ncbi:MAG: hypothetical protein WCI55_00970 [Armatimonadota bacterium]
MKRMKYATCLALVFAGVSYTVAHPPSGPSMCHSCTQITKPVNPCPLAPDTTDAYAFCGSEFWDNYGSDPRECKQFWKVTRTCQNGSHQEWTEEQWWGADTTCNTGSCHAQ